MAKTLALLLLAVGTYGQQIKSKCMQADPRLDTQKYIDLRLYLNRQGESIDAIVYEANLSNLQEAPMAFGEPIFEAKGTSPRKCIWNSRYNIWVLGDCVDIGKNKKPLDKLANSVCPYNADTCQPPTSSGRIPWEKHDTGK